MLDVHRPWDDRRSKRKKSEKGDAAWTEGSGSEPAINFFSQRIFFSLFCSSRASCYVRKNFGSLHATHSHRARHTFLVKKMNVGEQNAKNLIRLLFRMSAYSTLRPAASTPPLKAHLDSFRRYSTPSPASYYSFCTFRFPDTSAMSHQGLTHSQLFIIIIAARIKS